MQGIANNKDAPPLADALDAVSNGQAILPKLLRCIENVAPVTIMMQVIQHRIPALQGLLFCAETSARCPLVVTALRHNPLSRRRGNR